MPDVFTKRKRSEVMSRIRGKGNKDTEIALAKLLRANHIAGWRRQQTVRIAAIGAIPRPFGFEFQHLVSLSSVLRLKFHSESAAKTGRRMILR